MHERSLGVSEGGLRAGWLPGWTDDFVHHIPLFDATLELTSALIAFFSLKLPPLK